MSLAGAGIAKVSIEFALVACELIWATSSPSVAVAWFSSLLHSCIIAKPLPEKTLLTFSEFTQVEPVLRKTASSHAEYQTV